MAVHLYIYHVSLDNMLHLLIIKEFAYMLGLRQSKRRQCFKPTLSLEMVLSPPSTWTLLSTIPRAQRELGAADTVNWVEPPGLASFSAKPIFT